MESMGKKPRRRRSFTPEFKAEIVELCHCTRGSCLADRDDPHDRRHPDGDPGTRDLGDDAAWLHWPGLRALSRIAQSRCARRVTAGSLQTSAERRSPRAAFPFVEPEGAKARRPFLHCGERRSATGYGVSRGG